MTPRLLTAAALSRPSAAIADTLAATGNREGVTGKHMLPTTCPVSVRRGP